MRNLVLACFILLASIASGETIADLEVEGNRRVDASLIMSVSQLGKGDFVTQDLFSTAIKRVYALGLFKDVSVDTQTVAGNLVVKIRVDENPVLDELSFEGNREIKEKDLRETVEIREGDIVSQLKAFNAVQRLKGLYNEKGFLLTEITPRLEEDGEKAKLLFLIEEGKKQKIREIRVEGCRAFSSSRLEKLMKNREKTWYRKAEFKPDYLKEDIQAIQDFYYTQGYIEVNVMEPEIIYHDDEEWVTIVITVEEGMRYHIGNMQFAGNTFFQIDLLENQVMVSRGAVYNREKIDATLEKLYALYYDEGYIYAQIVPDEVARQDTIDVEFRIVEGNPAEIRKVEIEGNDQTLEKVIRREIVLYPGDIFKRSKVIRSQQEIFNLGYFKNIVIDSRTTGDDIDLIFKVEEKPSAQVAAGVTASQVDGVAGYFQLRHPNLFGRGQSINLMVERGGKKQNIELGFTEPWLLDHPISVGADIYYLTRIREYWDEKRRGGSLRLGVPFPPLDYTRVYWRYSLGDLGIFNIEEGYLSEWGEELEEGFKRTSATKISFVRDSRDNIFSATTGSMNHYSVEFAGGLLGGEVDFHKHILETRWYCSTFWKFVLMGRIRAGLVGGYTTPRSVPVYEKFFLGGIGEDGLRGYPDRSIGPQVNGRNVGGRTMLLMGLEYKFPLAENIHALLFFDAGNTWESAEKSRMSDLYKGVGFGIRIDVPMLGMIGFDFGYGIDRNRWEPHFQLGVPF